MQRRHVCHGKNIREKITRHYVARILSVDEEQEYTVSFIKKVPHKSFLFPDKQDIAVIDETEIRMVPNPKFNEGDEYIFSKDLSSFFNL